MFFPHWIWMVTQAAWVNSHVNAHLLLEAREIPQRNLCWKMVGEQESCKYSPFEFIHTWVDNIFHKKIYCIASIFCDKLPLFQIHPGRSSVCCELFIVEGGANPVILFGHRQSTFFFWIPDFLPETCHKGLQIENANSQIWVHWSQLQR